MITQKELKELLNYDPSSGLFTWAISDGGHVVKGEPAGWLAGGYSRIMLNGRAYAAHRLAWLYVYGAWPENHVDHIDGVKSNNRILNLRDVTRSGNGQNIRKAKGNTSSGLLGVSWHKQSKRWAANIRLNRKCMYIGLFDDPAEAHQAYLRKKREIHPFGEIAK